MMRMHAPLFSVSLLAVSFAASLGAQAKVPQNGRNLWDRSVEYVSRGSVGSDTGFISQAFPFGQLAGLKTLTLIRYDISDQNLATQEPWNLRYCGLDKAGHPDYRNGTFIAKGMKLPIGTGNGGAQITHNFTGTGVNAPKPFTHTGGRWHFCWEFTKKTNWTTDGLGVYMSQAGAQMPSNRNTALCYWSGGVKHREMNRVEGNNAVLNMDLAQSTGPNNSYADLTRSWELDLGFQEVTLMGGCENKTYTAAGCANPNYGYGGIDPDFNDTSKGQPKREDNFAWSVQAGSSYSGGLAFLLSSTAAFSKPIPTPFGPLYLNPINDVLFNGLGLLVFPKPLDAKGVGEFLFKIPGSVRPIVASIPSWHAQVLVVKPGQSPQLSSLHQFRPWLDEKLTGNTKFTRAKASSTAAVTIPRPTSFFPSTLYIRNDGPGYLLVDEYTGAKLARTFRVHDRIAVRESVSPAGSKWVIRSPHSAGASFVYRWNY